MTRMAKKGWLKVNRRGNTNHYVSTISLKEGLSVEISRFLEGVVATDADAVEILLDALRERASDRDAG